LLALPDREDIDLAVLRRVEQLVREGATIVGRPPARSSGLTGVPASDEEVRRIAGRLWGGCSPQDRKLVRFGKGEVVCGLSAREVLALRGVAPDFQFTGAPEAQLDFTHRSTPEAEIYFVHNRRRRAEEVMAEFRVRGRVPELWDAASGERQDAPEFTFTATGARLPLALEPEGSLFVVFRRAGKPAAAPKRTPGPAPLSITGPWQVRFGESPERRTIPALSSWTASSDPRVKYFSGIAEYETEFTLPENWLSNGRRALLDLGDLWAVAEVHLNERNLGVAWKRPFRLEATPALQPGRNRLRIRVANNWVNRLVGDALAAPEARSTRTNILTTGGRGAQPWRNVPLRESGLLGPVRLQPPDALQ
jgi:hypothetical protein